MKKSFYLRSGGPRCSFYYEGGCIPVCAHAVETLIGRAPRSIRIDVSTTKPKRGRWSRAVMVGNEVRIGRNEFHLLEETNRRLMEFTTQRVFWVRIVKD